MKRALKYIKMKNLGMMLSLSFMLALVSVVAIFAAADNPNAPAVNIRHEAVATHEGSQIYRMVVSARAPGGFNLFGIVISYDNRVILPVNSDSHTDIAAPTNQGVQGVTSEPFSVLASGFTEAPDAWLAQGYRTGFSFDVFTTGHGVTSDEFADVFAFYYRRIHSGDGNFRIEDGRYAASMVGTETQVNFIRPGVQMQSGDTTYIWGPHTTGHGYSEIGDGNIVVTGMVAAESTPPEATPEPEEPEATPTPSPEPGATPTPEPGALPTPSPAPSSAPGASPTPSPSSAPSPSPTPGSDARPNPTTNPIQISFSIFGAVTMLGLTVTGIFNLTKKQKAQADQYNSDLARHNREERITDMLDKK